jgi:hypothetical protein
MIGIAIANSVGIRRSSGSVVVVPIATAATGVGQTSFTANWNAFAGANYYLLDVSLNSSFSSFVGSYQNYVVIGTSQLVSGLTPNTTYYYRLRAATGVDSDAASFFTRVYTAGGTLSYSEVTATETLVYDMKAAGVWTAMKAVYPMIGSSAAACAQNLKSSSFTGTFSSGWTFASTGVTPNGTSAFMSTGLIPSVDFTTILSSHLSTYSRTQSRGGVDIGCTGPGEFGLSADLNIGAIYAYASIGNTSANSANNTSVGFFLANRQSSTNVKAIQNNTTLATTTSTASNTRPTVNVTLGQLFAAGLYSARQTAFASIGDGLTDTQASNFYTAVQTFNQTLNRSVGPQIVSDSDAQAYINRVYTAGGTLTNTEASAVNQLVIDMKTAGIWTSMKAVYPMVGASAAACAQNLRSSSFTGSFSSGWTFASTGASPNGTSAFMNTGFIPNTNFNSNNDISLGYYTRNFATGGVTLTGEMGSADGGLNNGTYLIIYYNVLGQSVNRVASNSSQLFNITPTPAFYSLSRVVSTEFNYYRNSTLLATPTIASSGRTANSMWVGGVNYGGSAEYGQGECAFSFIGDGLNSTQVGNLYTAVQAFQTTLGRQVAG